MAPTVDLTAQVEESRLVITVLSCTDLPNMDTTGKTDSYVKVRVSAKEFRTKTVKNRLNPVFDKDSSTFKFPVEGPVAGTRVYLTVMDKDSMSSDDLVGTATIRLTAAELTGTKVSAPILSKTDNIASHLAMDTYCLGWAKGDHQIFLTAVDPDYSFSGVTPEPVTEAAMDVFWPQFRAQVAEAGGPPVSSTDFMRFSNIARKEWKNQVFESANWSIPGYATGVYQCLALNGKVAFEHAVVSS